MPSQIIVLESFPAPRATSVNPYTLLLASSIREAGVTVEHFSWRFALLGKFDVFHVHWPEILVDGRTPARRLVRQALTVAFIARLAIKRIPLVRTVHNVELPEGLSRRQRLILRLIDRRTAHRVVLNSHTPVPAGSPVTIAPHAHFRDWFAGFEPRDAVPGQLGYIGRIRRYKGVEGLLAAFRRARGIRVAVPSSPEGELSLRIAGFASTPELERSLQAEADRDDRVTIEFGFVSDATIVEVVSSSELVVLPYRLMHNSSAAITALSLDRPILVPANEVTADLAREVGEGWVHLFDGELSSDAIIGALEAVRARGAVGRPRLDDREWSTTGTRHRAAFETAIAGARR